MFCLKSIVIRLSTLIIWRKISLRSLHTFFDGFPGLERHSFNGRLILSLVAPFLIERSNCEYQWFHEISQIFWSLLWLFEFSRINKVLEQNYCTKMPLMITYWWILALVTKPTSLFTFLSCSTSRSRLELDTLNRVHKWWYCSSLFRPTTITPSIYCWVIIVVFI